MTYARYISATEVAYPDYSKPPFAGVPNARTNDALHRLQAYLPLVGEHTPPEGHTAVPTGFALVEQSETHSEPRAVEVPDYDPDTHEQTGSHTEWRDTEVTKDTSYISVTEWEDVPEPEPSVSVSDYNDALEEYLLEVRTERGYTDRDPALYASSSVERWAQDAVDWVAFRDEVMLYGLQVENYYAAGGDVPSLDEFKAHLRTISCNWTYAK